MMNEEREGEREREMMMMMNEECVREREKDDE